LNREVAVNPSSCQLPTEAIAYSDYTIHPTEEKGNYLKALEAALKGRRPSTDFVFVNRTRQDSLEESPFIFTGYLSMSVTDNPVLKVNVVLIFSNDPCSPL
jgi:hypothetical protein